MKPYDVNIVVDYIIFNEETSFFYIVLLDPKHNIQPSRDYGYAVYGRPWHNQSIESAD